MNHLRTQQEVNESKCFFYNVLCVLRKYFLVKCCALTETKDDPATLKYLHVVEQSNTACHISHLLGQAQGTIACNQRPEKGKTVHILTNVCLVRLLFSIYLPFKYLSNIVLALYYLYVVGTSLLLLMLLMLLLLLLLYTLCVTTKHPPILLEKYWVQSLSDMHSL